MKKTQNLISKAGKILLVFAILFSQLSFPLSVLAEEVSNATNTDETIGSEEITNEEDQNNTTDGDANNKTTEEKESTESDSTNNTEENNSTDNIVEDNTTNEENSTDNKTNEDTTTDNNEDNNSTENGSTSDENQNTEGDNTADEDKTPEGDDSEETTTNSVNLELKEDLLIVRNNLDVKTNLKNFQEKLNELATETEITITKIIDQDEVEVLDEEQTILTNYKVFTITEEQEVIYTVIILGDYDNDGMVTLADQTIMLNKLKENLTEEELLEIIEDYDLNQDGVFNILDVNHSIYIENTWDITKEATDSLTSSLTPEYEEVYEGEEIKVDYALDGFQVDKLYGIQGTLNYNKEALELTNITVNGVEQDITELKNNKIIYLLDGYQTNGVLITLTFNALEETEEAVVLIEDIILSLEGVAANVYQNKVKTGFAVLAEAKGGDVETEEPTVTQPTTPVVTQPQPTTPVVNTVKKTTTVKQVSLSTDNYIKELTISGYKINFDKDTLEYSIKVKNSVKSLDLNIVLNDANATYVVECYQNFEVGKYTVKIIVTAEDGSTRTYSITVKRAEKETDEEEQEENSSSKTVIIILIILVIIRLIYVIFKDDEEDKQETKKETKKQNRK